MARDIVIKDGMAHSTCRIGEKASTDGVEHDVPVSAAVEGKPKAWSDRAYLLYVGAEIIAASGAAKVGSGFLAGAEPLSPEEKAVRKAASKEKAAQKKAKQTASNATANISMAVGVSDEELKKLLREAGYEVPGE